MGDPTLRYWVKHPFDPDEPECVRCATSMYLLAGHEWNDDEALNLCSDCSAIVITELQNLLELASGIESSMPSGIKKVQQTQYGIGRGDCLLACVASVLHRDLNSIPDFMQSSIGWFDDLYEWCLSEHIGIFYIKEENLNRQHLLLNCNPILIYKVRGYHEHHAVVGSIVLDGHSVEKNGDELDMEWNWHSEIVFDPNPNTPDLGALWGMLLLIPPNLEQQELR